MKIAFSTSGSTLDAPLDNRFGRARGFLIYDLESGDVEIIDNTQSLNSPSGAGIQAAEAIVRSGATGLVTGHCGPKAFRVLSAAGVVVYNTDAETVAEALKRYKSGSLKPADTADVEGHWA
ncbi:MAG: NifB/NifX family molybdenum-iron cluster-binding protein [bacterium]